MRYDGEILFKEEQTFRQGWVWFVFLFSSVMMFFVLIVSYVLSKEPDDELLLSLAIVIPVQLLITALMYYTKLQTFVTEMGVEFKWSPIMRKNIVIRWEEIEKAELRKGPPFQYGFKFSFRYGRVHKVNDGQGMQFYLKNGRKIFLGTQRPTAFYETVADKLGHHSKMKTF